MSVSCVIMPFVMTPSFAFMSESQRVECEEPSALQNKVCLPCSNPCYKETPQRHLSRGLSNGLCPSPLHFLPAHEGGQREGCLSRIKFIPEPGDSPRAHRPPEEQGSRTQGPRAQQHGSPGPSSCLSLTGQDLGAGSKGWKEGTCRSTGRTPLPNSSALRPRQANQL